LRNRKEDVARVKGVVSDGKKNTEGREKADGIKKAISNRRAAIWTSAKARGGIIPLTSFDRSREEYKYKVVRKGINLKKEELLQ